MNNVLVSIIVPVYNSGLYLNECINSLLSQTYKNIEIIIIDDGSCDDSKKIVDSFNDSRIIYIYSSHRGVSFARNLGIKRAKGEIIMFTDSDDFVSPNYVFCLLSNYNASSSLVICGYTRHNMFTYSNKNYIITNTQTYEYLLNKRVGGYLFNKAFRSSIIKDNQIFFDEEISMNEDMLFVSTYLKYCKNIVINDSKLYFYRKHSMELTKRYDKNTCSSLIALSKIIDIYRVQCDRCVRKLEYKYLKKKYEFICLKLIDSDYGHNFSNTKFSFRERIVLFLYKYFGRIINLIKRI